MIRHSSRVLEDIRSLGNLRKREINVGTSLVFSGDYIVRLWLSMRSKFPDVQLLLIPFENTREQADLILSSLGERVDVLAGMFDERFFEHYHCSGMVLERIPIGCSIPISHPLSGRKQISLHDLRGQTVYICEYGLLEDFDAAFDVLKAHCPQSTLVPFNFLDFEVFTQAEKDKAVIINVQHWPEAHPLFKSCAIDWPLTARFGLIFAKHPSASLQLFLDCLPRPQPQA